MKLGIGIPSYGPYTDAGLIREVVLRTEACGYHSVWFPDNLFTAPGHLVELGSQWHDPYTLCGYAAGITQNVKIGIAVTVLPFRHPAAVAKMASTIDHLSHGRFILGVGVGNVASEFAALGLDFRQRGAMCDEYLRALKELWTSALPSFQGKYVQFSGLTLDPKPVQRPHPPIWVGGNSAAALRRTAVLCDGWHPVGLTPGEMMQRIVELRNAAAATGRTAPIIISCQGPWVRIAGVPSGQEPETKGGKRVPLNGSPQEIIQDLVDYAHAGVEHLVLRFSRVPDGAGFLNAFEYFHKHVRPFLPF